MNKITLDVSEQNREIVLVILENLKTGLIQNIEVDKTTQKHKTAYKPKLNKVIYENEQMSENISGKYLNPASYKKRLKK